MSVMRFGRFALAAFCAAGGMAQEYSAPAGYRGPREGKVVIIAEPVMSAASLDHLIRASAVIVEGTVVSQSTLNIRKSPGAPLFETYSVVGIYEVLSGTLPNHSANILVSEIGGTRDGLEIEVRDNPVLKSGERYILFLQVDDRKELASISALPSYLITGVWSGKIRVKDDKVTFVDAAHPRLHKYDNTDVNAFRRTLKEAIEHPPVSTTPLPIHPTPPSQR